MTEFVREATQNGRLLVTTFMEIFTDKRERSTNRMVAGQWLADRGFGKAVGLDVLVKVDASKAAGSLPTLDTAVLEALVSGLTPSLAPGSASSESTPTLVEGEVVTQRND